MTVVITPVGTSLFSNCAEVNRTVQNIFNEDFRNARASDWDDWEYEIDLLKEASEEFIGNLDERAAAEFQSSYAIRSRVEQDITVRLFASDTIVSKLAAEILQSKAENVLGEQCIFEFDPSEDVIEGLQGTLPLEFQRTGIPNLMQWLDSIYGETRENSQELAINITAGYGAFIPPLTLSSKDIGQIPLYYHFKDATVVIDLSEI